MIKTTKAELDQDKTDPYDAIIWNNHDIKIATKPIFYASWYKAGVINVKHLLNSKIKSSFSTYYGLLSVIKNKWKFPHYYSQRQTRKQNWFDIY